MLNYKQLESTLFEDVKVENSELFDLTSQLAQKAEPNLVFSEKDKRWLYFYLPVLIDEQMYPATELALVPLALIWQKRSRPTCCETYYLIFPSLGSIQITKGTQHVSNIYKEILRDTIDFLPKLKANPKLVEDLVPYIFRRGRIKRKYVEKPELSEEEARKLLELYKKRNKSGIYPISLKDYLRVAGYCIRAVYPEKSHLSDRELYERHSDFRRADMLKLDPENPKEFSEWYESKIWLGSHPFEIIAGASTIGIVLFPPDKKKKRYKLIVGEHPLHAFDLHYVKCVKALLKKNVPFDAPQLEKVLDYLTGEAYLPVNEDPWGIECEGTEEFVKYVEWEPLTIPKLK